MQPVPAISLDRELLAKIAFRILGIGLLLLFLVSNPLVLRPRFWNASFVSRSMTINAVLLLEAFGFLLLRKWAALLNVVALVTIAFISSTVGFNGAVIGLTLVPVALSVFFWRNLVWGNHLRDFATCALLIVLVLLAHVAVYLTH
jgi:hypothetical protein